MTTNEISAVINMVTEKIGAGVSQVTPLAEEIVREYQIRGLVFAILGLVLTVVGSSLLVWSYKLSNKDDDYEGAIIVSLVLGAVGVVFGAVAMSCGISAYVAPLCGLIGK